MQQASIYQQYKANSLQTITQGEAVVRLLEEASKQISMSIFLTNQNNSYKSFNCISKAQKIISTLNNNLDIKYPISIQLKDLYDFLYERLAEVNIKKDIDLLKDLLSIVDELKVTFRQADRIATARR